MTDGPGSADLPDRVDDALAALWAGSSDAFDRLIGEDEGHDGPIGRVLGESASAACQRFDHPKEIGRFEILGELGRGGMGIVYRARQRHPHRVVALKVIRGADLIDEQRVRLFQREVQTLARLRHPNIAALYETGQTEDGQHFFVMELINGVPLTHFAWHAAGGKVPFDPSLALAVFCRVCDAISYAHQRGVIHRDIKPSNILVDPQTQSDSGSDLLKRAPEVKVLDFGLARVTDADVATVTAAATTERVEGTLPYMSPEQLLGDSDEIDIRSDVYSLGVVLYQLLTGRLPFDAKKRSIAETMRAIREENPPRPSTIRRGVRGDLETIVLKAIERDPARRYQSVAALAEDIVRFLGDQPILARPPSAAYQARKLIARHKVGFGAAAALLLVSVGAAAVSTVSLVQARAAERTANEQRQVAEAVNHFLSNMLSHVNPRQAQGRDTTLLRELLADAAERIETELGNQPRVRSALDTVIGQAYLSLGAYEQADHHLVRALTTHRSHFGADHPKTLEVMNELAILRTDQGRLDEGLDLHEEALDGRRRVLGDDHPDTLASLNDLGNLYLTQHRPAEAHELLTQAVDGRKRVLGEEHPDTLVSMNNLANVLIRQKRYARAEKLLRAVLASQRKSLPEDHLDVLVSMNDLAMVLSNTGKPEEAELLYQKVADGFRRQLGEGHMDTLIVTFNLEGLRRERRTPQQAAEAMAKLTATAENHLPPDHYIIGVFRSTYARRLLDADRPADAEPHAVRGFEELRAAVGAAHVYTQKAADTVADVYEALEQPDQAAPYRTFLEGDG